MNALVSAMFADQGDLASTTKARKSPKIIGHQGLTAVVIGD